MLLVITINVPSFKIIFCTHQWSSVPIRKTLSGIIFNSRFPRMLSLIYQVASIIPRIVRVITKDLLWDHLFMIFVLSRIQILKQYSLLEYLIIWLIGLNHEKLNFHYLLFLPQEKSMSSFTTLTTINFISSTTNTKWDQMKEAF